MVLSLVDVRVRVVRLRDLVLVRGVVGVLVLVVFGTLVLVVVVATLVLVVVAGTLVLVVVVITLVLVLVAVFGGVVDDLVGPLGRGFLGSPTFPLRGTNGPAAAVGWNVITSTERVMEPPCIVLLSSVLVIFVRGAPWTATKSARMVRGRRLELMRVIFMDWTSS